MGHFIQQVLKVALLGIVFSLLVLEQRILVLLDHVAIALDYGAVGIQLTLIYLDTLPNPAAIPVTINQAAHE